MPARENFGISPALSTPFGGDGRVDTARLHAHAADLIRRGCQSVTVFGTTGEGPSVGLAERHRAIDALIAAGIPAGKIVSGIISCSPEESIEALSWSLARGLKASLLAPPFYFRGVDDDSLSAWFEQVFKAAGPKLSGVILYHIPEMTGVALPHAVIGRLKQAFPGAILGVKDSSGDRDHTFRLLKAHGDLTILVGDERYLGAACAAGASGAICGMGNLLPERMVRIVQDAKDDPVVQRAVEAIVSLPVIPAVKAAIGHLRRDAAWNATRPPLAALSQAQLKTLAAALDQVMAEAGR